MKASQSDSNGTNLEKWFHSAPHHLFLFKYPSFSRKTSARDMLASVWVGVNINFFFLTIHDSYELLPISLTGLGGVDRFELLFEPRLCRGEPSRLQSYRCGWFVFW